METKKVNGHIISIKFYYGRSGLQGLYPNETLASIVIDDSKSFSGITKKHSVDMFCKEKARKTALKRALTGCNDRQVRTMVWEAYFSRKNK